MSSYVFPVRYVSEGISVQTTSRELSSGGIAVRALSPPHVGARVTLALYLPNIAIPEVAIARVARSKPGGEVGAAASGFWADFLVLDPQARMRISSLLSDHAQGGSNRAFARFPVRLELRVGKTGLLFAEHALNVSRSGVFVYSEVPPDEGESLEVELHLPGGAPVSSCGVVVHRQTESPSGAGIQFIDANDAFRDRLDRFLEALPATESAGPTSKA
ncbi:MAG TPA: PilZ domain-containing protein [Myxococcales bacterium]